MKLVAQMNGSQCSLMCSRFRMAVIAPVMIRVMPRPRISPIGTESNWNSTMGLCFGAWPRRLSHAGLDWKGISAG